MEFLLSHKTGFLHPLLVLAELYGIVVHAAEK